MRKILTVPLAAAAMLALAAPATAAAKRCLPYDSLVDHLAQSYDEHRQSMGVTPGGELVEVFASEAGTFTLVLSQPKGVSCVLAIGEGWDIVPEVAVGPGA